ncbi:hypothetical protein L1987_75741 [Smallanthus sonchifolius]|uniref:Uncharacterized protein n=1 Tax=Smallanthus sonchifolius TaxID=185202 RepID=A0ACB9A5L2_9ASTR|nr:hypothetical protein L1987_75741 [Smallanthus sonchifolius]
MVDSGSQCQEEEEELREDRIRIVVGYLFHRRQGVHNHIYVSSIFNFNLNLEVIFKRISQIWIQIAGNLFLTLLTQSGLTNGFWRKCWCRAVDSFDYYLLTIGLESKHQLAYYI